LVNAILGSSIGPNNKTNVIDSIIGQPSAGVAASQAGAGQPGNTASAVINSIGNLASGAGKILTAFF
jgi:hypothetical protein